MPQVLIHNFLPLMLQHAPSMPSIVAAEHLRQAAIIFCERTRCWRQSVEVTVTGNPTAITVPLDAVVHEIESAYWPDVNEPLTPASYADFTPSEINGVPDAQTPPKWITQAAPDTFILLPAATGTVTLNLFLKPPAGGPFGADPIQSTLPDLLYNHHAQYLAFGGLATALMVPDQAVFDPKRAGHFAQQFQARIDAMASGFRRGQQRTRLRTRRSPWFN
jgi:hypothetical protein